MNTAFNLKTNGSLCPEISVNKEIKFTWEAPDELRQFTMQLSPMPDFMYIQYLRDTDKHGMIYDGPILKPDMKYYWRIRTGIYDWMTSEFTTKK